MSDTIRFGPAGTSESFKAMGYKNSKDIPAHTARFGLHAFGVPVRPGVRLSNETAAAIRANAEGLDIRFSVHAPYYISMSSLEEDKRLASVDYILQSCRAVRALGGSRVIFHAGSSGKGRAGRSPAQSPGHHGPGPGCRGRGGLRGYHPLPPRTMGKINQLGDLEEVLALCSVDKRITPCIDFGHLNARTLGGVGGKEQFAAILDRMGRGAGG